MQCDCSRQNLKASLHWLNGTDLLNVAGLK